MALLDKDNPTKVISRATNYIFEPEETFEKFGQVNNVVFPCGAVIRGNELFLYYGGADSVLGVAVANLSTAQNSLINLMQHIAVIANPRSRGFKKDVLEKSVWAQGVKLSCIF
jgi:predicted GH43/DUF377 family glycosyl hydrolase